MQRTITYSPWRACHPIRKSMLGFFFTCLLLTACSSSELQSGEDCGVPLTFSSATLSGVKTRATLSAGSIGVFRLTSTNYSTTRSNILYTCSGTWAPASTSDQIYLTSYTANIAACYPYNASYGTATAIPMTSGAPGTSDANALWYVKTTGSSATLPLTLSLSQAYAKITFSIIHGATYPDSCAITSIALTNSSLISTGTLDLTDTDGYPYTATATGSVSISPAIASIASGATNTDASVLMVPVSSLSGAVTITLTMDGNTYTATLAASTFTALAAGKNYTISLTINGTGLTVGTVSITDWSEGAGAVVTPE
jgi:hypothetical protein